MNVRIVVAVGAAGALIGVATVFGLIPAGHERWFWLAVGVVSAVVIARVMPNRHFLEGFAAGFVACTLAPLIQGACFDTYLAHNALAADTFKSVPAGLSPRLLVLVSAPVIGVLMGTVLGLMSWLAAKLTPRRRKQEVPA
jgi:ABC-type dipeptide/oligopeptide/nickel transport system permease subunit